MYALQQQRQQRQRHLPHHGRSWQHQHLGPLQKQQLLLLLQPLPSRHPQASPRCSQLTSLLPSPSLECMPGAATLRRWPLSSLLRSRAEHGERCLCMAAFALSNTFAWHSITYLEKFSPLVHHGGLCSAGVHYVRGAPIRALLSCCAPCVHRSELCSAGVHHV